MDKTYLISGLVNFWTGPQGVLEVVNGKEVLNKKKDFNKARQFRNAGINMFRELRRGIVKWGAVRPFDWDSPGYWPMLLEHFDIISNPFQGPNPPPRAKILYELFDECGGDTDLFFGNPDLARELIHVAATNFRGLDYVFPGAGNECNDPRWVAFYRDVIFPEFKEVGWVPFSYGAWGDDTGPTGQLELQKNVAVAAWDNLTAHYIFRQIHAIIDDKTNYLTNSLIWINNPFVPIIYGDDGAVTGASTCDSRELAGWWGPIQRGPSTAQTMAMMQWVFDRAQSFTLPNGGIKYGFENLAIATDNDPCTVKSIEAMSDCYAAKFGVQPFSRGKFPSDWVDPAPPPTEYRTIAVNLGPGTTGTPAATKKYIKGIIVNFNYSALPGYDNLQVKRDGVYCGTYGQVGTYVDHVFDVSATPILPPDPEPDPDPGPNPNPDPIDPYPIGSDPQPQPQTLWQRILDVRHWTWQAWIGLIILVVILILIF
jgi:hypothetical protein